MALIAIFSLSIFTKCSKDGDIALTENESVDAIHHILPEGLEVPLEEQKIPMAQRIEVLEVPPEFVYTRRKTYDQDGIVAITLAHKYDDYQQFRVNITNSSFKKRVH